MAVRVPAASIDAPQLTGKHFVYCPALPPLVEI